MANYYRRTINLPDGTVLRGIDAVRHVSSEAITHSESAAQLFNDIGWFIEKEYAYSGGGADEVPGVIDFFITALNQIQMDEPMRQKKLHMITVFVYFTFMIYYPFVFIELNNRNPEFIRGLSDDLRITFELIRPYWSEDRVNINPQIEEIIYWRWHGRKAFLNFLTAYHNVSGSSYKPLKNSGANHLRTDPMRSNPSWVGSVASQLPRPPQTEAAVGGLSQHHIPPVPPQNEATVAGAARRRALVFANNGLSRHIASYLGGKKSKKNKKRKSKTYKISKRSKK